MAANLPNELFLIILDFISPDDLVNTALTCSSIYNLATDRLEEHQDLRIKYCEVKVTNALKCSFLEEAYQNPRVRFYVKTLRYIPSAPSANRRGLNYMAMIESLLNSSPYMKYENHFNTQGREIIADIKSRSFRSRPVGWTGWFLGFLLSYLPNITELITSFESERQYPDRLTIEAIIGAKAQNKGPRGLQKLTYIRIAPRGGHPFGHLEWVIPVLGLPSLLRLRGDGLCFYDKFEWPFGKQTSLLEEIDVYSSDINYPLFLSALTNLRKLTYNYYSEGLDHLNEDIYRYEFLANLEHYCSSTLEILDISYLMWPPPMSSSLRSFHGFKKLEKLVFPASLVFGTGERDDAIHPDRKDPMPETLDIGPSYEDQVKIYQAKGVPRLVDILPPSIKMVYIDIKGCTNSADRFFEGLAELKHERLPNLEYITFWYGQEEDRCLDSLDRLSKLGASVGVKVGGAGFTGGILTRF